MNIHESFMNIHQVMNFISPGEWGYIASPLCECGEPHTMRHVVNECPLTCFDGGISELHLAQDAAFNWLLRQSLRSWKANDNNNNNSIYIAHDRVPKVMEKHRKKSCHWKSWKSNWKWAKKIKSWKSWKSHGISLLLITNHAREGPIIPYLQAYCSDLAMGGFRFMF